MWWSCLPKIEECGPRPLPLWTSDWTRGPRRVFRQTNYYKLTFKVQRTANEYAPKRGIYKRPDQQKYTLSRHTEFCKADRATAVDSCFTLFRRKGRNRCLMLRPRSVFGSFGVVLMSCKVNFHVVRSALQNLVCLLKLLQVQSPRKIFCHSNIPT